MKSAYVSPEIAALAYEIADSCARSDIECNCPRKWGRWYDTTEVDERGDQECVARALRYLDARGLVKHHADAPALVNFEGLNE